MTMADSTPKKADYSGCIIVILFVGILTLSGSIVVGNWNKISPVNLQQDIDRQDREHNSLVDQCLKQQHDILILKDELEVMRIRLRGLEESKNDSKKVVEYFKKTQAATVTPHGKIDIDSVKEERGSIWYKTSDGTTWSVSYVHIQSTDSYWYGTPIVQKK